jgi:hypothetical protein
MTNDHEIFVWAAAGIGVFDSHGLFFIVTVLWDWFVSSLPLLQSASRCMQTFVARSLNEVWMEHLFQLAVMFHGGTQAIAYEWGSPNHEVCVRP